MASPSRCSTRWTQRPSRFTSCRSTRTSTGARTWMAYVAATRVRCAGRARGRPWPASRRWACARSAARAAREVEAARAYGSHLITAERVHAEGMDAVLATIPKGRAVYVTIDADGLDPADMPDRKSVV